MALEDIDPQSPVRESIEQIRKAGQQAAELTTQLLSMSRRQVVEPKVFRFEDLVQDTDKMLQRLIGADVQLECRMSDKPGSVKADGTFELKGLSGTRIVRVASLPPGWMLKSVRVNGNDVTDTGIDFKAGEAVTGVDVVVTSKLTEVNGTVKAGSEQAKDYTLVVFSDEPQKWSIPNSRFVAGTRPDQEGRFQIKNLPAGGYLAIAVDYLAQGEWNDPDVLERLKPKATSFSIDEGETKTLNLTLR